MTEVKDIIGNIEKVIEEITSDSDKLSKHIKEINVVVGRVAQKAGLTFVSAVPHFIDENDSNQNEYLAICAYPNWGLFTSEDPDRGNYDRPIQETTREVKLTAVNDIGRFLDEYSWFLKKKSYGYKEAADLAEKIKNAIS